MPFKRQLRTEQLEPRLPLTGNLIADLNLDGAGSNPADMVAFNDLLVFTASDDVDRRLWITDGTTAGTKPAVNLLNNFEVKQSAVVGDDLYFTSGPDSGTSIQLWRMNASSAVENVIPHGSDASLSLADNNLFEAGGQLYWYAIDDGLWTTNGTLESTRRLFSTAELYGLNRVNGIFETSSNLILSPDAGGPGDAPNISGFLRIDLDTKVVSRFAESIVSEQNRLYNSCDRMFDEGFVFCDGSSIWLSDGTDNNTTPIVEDVGSAVLYGKKLDGLKIVAEHNVYSHSTTNGLTQLNTEDFWIYEAVRLGDSIIVRAAVDSAFGIWNISASENTELVRQADDTSFGTTQSLVPTGDSVLFQFDSETEGDELWSTDGTVAGTKLVKDIQPGANSSRTFFWSDKHHQNYAVVHDKVYFAANTSSLGLELWSSDGTANGTHVVADLATTGADSHPSDWVSLGDKVLFNADSGLDGDRGLWSTDGATATRLDDISDEIRAVAGGTPLIFDERMIVFHNDNFLESDGTVDGTHSVPIGFAEDYEPLRPATVHQERLFVFKGHRLYYRETGNDQFIEVATIPDALVPETMFSYDSGLFWTTFSYDRGTELWKLAKIGDNPEPFKQFPDAVKELPFDYSISDVTVAGDLFFFILDDATTGKEVWRSDGTADGTFLLRDIVAGELSSRPAWLTEFNDKLYFQACGIEEGTELWTSDGTTEGTKVVVDVMPGESGSFAGRLTVYEDELFFEARDKGFDYELWKTDGTSTGTVQVSDINEGEGPSYPRGITLYAGDLYFSAQDENEARGLWRYDGNSEQVILADSSAKVGWDLVPSEQGLFYSASTPETGYEPWVFREPLEWHNSESAIDVNGSGSVSPIDALLVINELNSRRFTDSVTGTISTTVDPNGHLDVNNDGTVSPIDALLVINRLNDLSQNSSQSAATFAEAVASNTRDADNAFWSVEWNWQDIFDDDND